MPNDWVFRVFHVLGSVKKWYPLCDHGPSGGVSGPSGGVSGPPPGVPGPLFDPFFDPLFPTSAP